MIFVDSNLFVIDLRYPDDANYASNRRALNHPRRDRMARFTREAQPLAALDHPHIAQVHSLEETGSVRALVIESRGERSLLL